MFFDVFAGRGRVSIVIERCMIWVLGYLFATVVADWPIGCIVDRMWTLMPATSSVSGLRIPWKARLMGYVERALYVSAIMGRQPLLIGWWLTLKVAGRWKKIRRPEQEKGYEVYVMGCGLSVLHALAVSWSMRLGLARLGWLSLLPIAVLAIADVAICLYLCAELRRHIGA